MKLRTFMRKFSTDDACRAHLESVRWPEGPVCDRCGSVNEATPVGGRSGFWRCRPCGKQFSVTAEGFFGLFKRAVIGVWHRISPKHLHRYASEHEFRWNMRSTDVADRIARCLLGSHGRLRLRELLA